MKSRENKISRLFKDNFFSSSLLQFVNIAGTVISVPILLSFIGAEGYGIIALYTVFISILGLVDFGVTPLISRNTILFYSKTIRAEKYASIIFFAFLFLIFICSLILCSVYFDISSWISNKLDFSTLLEEDVNFALNLIILGCLTRWLSQGFLRAILIGSSRLWLANQISIIASLFRNFIPLIYCFFSTEPFRGYFVIVLIVFILEFLILYIFCKGTFLKAFSETSKPFMRSIESIKEEVGFSVSIFSASVMWLFASQIDRVAISFSASLEYFGYFGVIAIFINGFQMLNFPLIQTLSPKLVQLISDQMQTDEIEQITLRYIKISFGISFFICTIILLTSKHFLFLWTSDINLAEEMFFILKIYSLGFALSNIGQYLYVILYAKGKMKYHLIGTFSSSLFVITLCLLLVPIYFALGSSIVWFLVSSIFTLIWVPFVLERLGLKKIRRYILYKICPSFAFLSFFGLFSPFDFLTLRTTQESLLFFILVTAILTLFFYIFFIKNIKEFLKHELMD